MRYILTTILLLSLSGCGAIKEKTGVFITEAVVDHIAEKVDQRLERRGLSIDKLRNIADLNNDGKVNMEEVVRTAKLAVGEALIARTSSWEKEQRERWEKATKNLVTRDEEAGLKGDVQNFWLWLKATIGALIAAIGTYLTKQVFSAKSDGKRDAEIAKGHARMDALERLTGRDLDNDGMIGHNGTPVPTTEA